MPHPDNEPIETGIERRRYRFEGGVLDGETIQIGNAHIGMEWRGPTLVSGRQEVYVLHYDNTFRVDRRSLPIRLHPDVLLELAPIFQKFAPIPRGARECT